MENPKHDTSTDPTEWTSVGFLNEFMRIHRTVNDRAFAFLLGAGASITSKIPAAGTLAQQWVEELYDRLVEDKTKTSIDDWATTEGFSLDKVAFFYTKIYDKRFSDDPELGYAYLEDAMSSAEPNIGYSILAKVIESTRHKVVITTNFDNLVADALSIYTDTFPLVCGHESLTSFVRSRLRRPLVAKIHRDLLLAPKSDTDGTAKLDERWAKVLRTLLKDYTPIVIGYGGNDGSLMDFLDQLEPGQIQGGIYWCYHRSSGKPEQRIRKLVARHKGKLIPIIGFDEFMLQLGDQLGYEPLADEIERRAQSRVKRYREEWEQFQKRIVQPAKDAETEEVIKPVREALAETVKREDSWWSWELKARAEQDPSKREEIYRQGLSQFPRSVELTNNFALFLTDIRKDYDEAEQMYKRALKLDPDNAIYMNNFANFLKNIRKDYDEAERLYKRAMELDPNNATNTGNFANFLKDIHKNFDEAERLYKRALELDPNNATNTGNFATFLKDIRKNYDEAERLYKRALELDPNNAIQTGNFATFLTIIRKDYDKAEQLYKRALELDPNHSNNTGNFANFLMDIHKNFDEAERLYKRAIDLDPQNAIHTGNFANFMKDIRKNYYEAERLYKQALELDPNNTNNMGNFASFLLENKRLDEAKDRIKQAFDTNKGQTCQLVVEILLYLCLIAQMERRDDTAGISRLKFILEKGFERVPCSFDTVLKIAGEKIPSEEMAFYSALADAILDPDKIPELEKFERWKQIEPAPLDEPWDM